MENLTIAEWQFLLKNRFNNIVVKSQISPRQYVFLTKFSVFNGCSVRFFDVYSLNFSCLIEKFAHMHQCNGWKFLVSSTWVSHKHNGSPYNILSFANSCDFGHFVKTRLIANSFVQVKTPGNPRYLFHFRKRIKSFGKNEIKTHFFNFFISSGFYISTRVGKTWLPCHDLAMIIPWSWRYMVKITSWCQRDGHVSWHGCYNSWHDHGMITMFSIFHTMIMVESKCLPCFFWEKRIVCR